MGREIKRMPLKPAVLTGDTGEPFKYVLMPIRSTDGRAAP